MVHQRYGFPRRAATSTGDGWAPRPPRGTLDLARRDARSRCTPRTTVPAPGGEFGDGSSAVVRCHRHVLVDDADRSSSNLRRLGEDKHGTPHADRRGEIEGAGEDAREVGGHVVQRASRCRDRQAQTNSRPTHPDARFPEPLPAPGKVMPRVAMTANPSMASGSHGPRPDRLPAPDTIPRTARGPQRGGSRPQDSSV